MVDEVVISIIEESQPRWLSFLNGRHDFMERVPEEFIGMAMPGGKIAPNLAKKGITGKRTVLSGGWTTIKRPHERRRKPPHGTRRWPALLRVRAHGAAACVRRPGASHPRGTGRGAEGG